MVIISLSISFLSGSSHGSELVLVALWIGFSLGAGVMWVKHSPTWAPWWRWAAILLNWTTLVLVVLFISQLIKNDHRGRLACVAHLKQIDGAKEQWALENKKMVGNPVVVMEVNDYLAMHTRKCPDGGAYSYNAVGTDPSCTLDEEGHRIQ